MSGAGLDAHVECERHHRTDGESARLRRRYGRLEGPGCFSGCSSLCLDHDFELATEAHGPRAAVITQRRPVDFDTTLRTVLTDADTYTVEFRDPALTPQNKATLLALVAQLDAMYFHLPGDACTCSPQVRVCSRGLVAARGSVGEIAPPEIALTEPFACSAPSGICSTGRAAGA